MIRILKTLAFIGMVLSLNSCGLIGPSMRSAGSLIKSLGDVAGPAAGAAL